MKELFEKYKDFFKISIISSILYYCGYLSSDYHNKIIGVNVNYSTLDIVKWGGDFFIYTIIDFFKSLSDFNQNWVKKDFVMLIFGLLMGVTIIKIFQYNRRFNFISNFVILFTTGAIIAFSVKYVSVFTGSSNLEYSFFNNQSVIYSVYFSFIIVNIINILLHFLWVDNKYLKPIVLLPLLFLPALYGIYGRNYNFKTVVTEKLSEKEILLESYGDKDYILQRTFLCDTIDIVTKDCKNVTYQYLIKNSADTKLHFGQINFFDFIKPNYNEK